MYPHLSSEPHSESEWFDALTALTRFLRSPKGCPWDRERSALEFAQYARGEIDELCEALKRGNDRHAEEEYGDSLFTLLACMAAAEAEGKFSLRDAMIRAHEKMVRRHGHVFDDDRALTPEEAINAWDRIKEEETKSREQGGEAPRDPGRNKE